MKVYLFFRNYSNEPNQKLKAMKKIIFYVLALVFSVMLISCNQTVKTQQSTKNDYSPLTKLDSLFMKQGEILVYEPLKVLIGESDSIHAIYHLTLFDIEKYHGKVCPGIATGFIMFKSVIDSLYPRTHVVVRGQVAIAASNPNDMADVAGYIFGVRTNTCCGRGELGRGLLIIDTTLRTGVKKQFVIIFKRLDNGRTYKMTFNKFALMDKDQWPFIDETLHKFKRGEKLTAEEREKFAKMVHQEVLNVLANGPRQGTFSIEPTEYKFPFEK